MMYMAKKRRDGPQGYNGVRTKNNGAHDETSLEPVIHDWTQ
ncbi:hypothetical protein HanPI659440_Chr06g0230131 [Helianthus annuus]|nr:hypothetical protein HanPI659440_Chr06g0230131 [Helianthus annuus]